MRIYAPLKARLVFGGNAANKNKGFSLAELLVVFTMTALLSGGLVLYNRATERQIILFKEQSKVFSAVQKAKTLAIGAFSEIESEIICGYGVHFSLPNRIIIFKKLSPEDPKCQNVNFIYTSPNEIFEEIKLDKIVNFSELGLNDVVFIPPDPIVVIDNDFFKNEGLIKIKTIDNKGEKTIKITNAGQITTQ